MSDGGRWLVGGGGVRSETGHRQRIAMQIFIIIIIIIIIIFTTLINALQISNCQ